ncbi:hypothetical protein LQ327_04510 [Actinomycetospora endophytica]|uniref:SH3 domain-containing protein n=1 Tax=Actinomycetospora endophytica TaxID=2291215 RepID=A0ABS8P338_9PSEU|nr:hypothetical protein [Actinomycetospora endophytica]MCD2192651.1 hypothetical protein [Actinomycetospora endophytica]
MRTWSRRRRPASTPVVLWVLAAAAVLLLATGVAATGASPDDPGVVTPGTDAQRWDPQLAGSAVRVQVDGGAARLASPRDGEPPQRAGSLRGAQRQGFLDLGTHTFAHPVDRFDVPVTAERPPGTSIIAEVRGRDDAGRWTEWVPSAPGAPAVLPAPSRTVALRLTLTAPGTAAGPTVRSASVHADRRVGAQRELTPRASYKVFATREGLTGGTTSNGHVITENDQFVALPSRGALDADGKGDYSVRMCTDAGRCAIVPVWDVGPWNTDDDYWNPAPPRTTYTDLPQGMPQAQAAFQNKYNDGDDGLGRTVKNPAGIDVADGTFHALGLGDNSFVTVDYLWTGRAGESPTDVHLATADSPDNPVTIRSTPANGGDDKGLVGNDAQVDVQCHVAGDSVTGSHGTSTDWLRIDTDKYVPAAWMVPTNQAPDC